MLHTAQATGHVDGRPTQFTPLHREDAEDTATAQVSMTVPVSLADITAVLWIVIDGGMPLHELDDDTFVHQMVCETLFGEGGSRIAAARDELDELTPGSAQYDRAQALRARVAALYGQSVPAPRRALVGV